MSPASHDHRWFYGFLEAETYATKPLLVVGMNFIPRPLAIGMRFIPMDGGCLPHWDEALDESTGIIEAVYFAV